MSTKERSGVFDDFEGCDSGIDTSPDKEHDTNVDLECPGLQAVLKRPIDACQFGEDKEIWCDWCKRPALTCICDGGIGND